jgi:glycosyltransferase involved in cell wall biosynthesis
MKSLRILLVLNEAPLPFGHALGRWYSVLLPGLIERGHRVTAYTICADSKDVQKTRALFPSPGFDIRPYPFPERKSLWRKVTTLRRPFSYMIHPELRRDLHAELHRGYDILHLEGIWSGWLGEGCDPAKVVLNFHNLYDIDQAVQPLFSFPRSAWERGVHALRRRAEHRLLRSYGTLLTLTPRLKESVREIAPRTPVHVVPLGLNAEQYVFIPAERRSTQLTISLIGSMSWYPSHSAAVRLLTRLLPIIRSKLPEVRLVIVGWDARKTLGTFLPIPGVEVIENVPETRPFFESSSLLLYAPEHGSGMKVKVLEAFAYGVPVVTTSEGIEGIPARDGIHAGVSDEDAGLAERTLILLKDPARQESQRRAARALVEKHCHPRVVLDGVERCYEDILSRQRSQAA